MLLFGQYCAILAMDDQMDDIDLSLLDALQSDDRTSYADLGRAVGLSVSGVNARLKKLVAARYIREFAARLDPAFRDTARHSERILVRRVRACLMGELRVMSERGSKFPEVPSR